MPRIVSLIASATEIVDALGMTPFLVGRSHECDYPAAVRVLPVCTRPRIPVDGSSREIDVLVKSQSRDSLSIYDVFEDVLAQLEPTHIVTQIQCEVCAVSLRDVEQAISRGIRGQPRIVSLQPDSLAAIWEDFRRVARALDIAERGESVISALQARMKPTPADPTARPRVAVIEWIEPLMAAGNWTPELVGLGGGVDLFGRAGQHSPWLSWEQLKAGDPDVVIVAPCGFDIKRTAQEMYWLTGRADWKELRAARSGAVYLADGNQYFNRPGPRVVETFEILREILHPEIPPRHRGSGWRDMMGM